VFTLSDSNDWTHLFLHKGDYEKYQGNTKLNPHTKEYLIQALQAEKELARGLWIMNRLTRYWDVHWTLLNKETVDHYNMILYYQKQIKAYDDYSGTESETRTKPATIGPIGAIIEAN